MYLVSGINNNHKFPIQYGKHKIPRFIYHITSKNNYNKLLIDGTLRMSEDLFCGEGVFTSELDNIFKNSARAWKGKSLLGEIVKAYDETKPIKSIFNSLLEGTPEQKETLFLNY